MVVNVNVQTNYTKVSNGFLQDKNLSGDAKIVGVLLMSFPKNWEVNIKHLSELLQKGEKTIRKGIKELIDNGKLKISQARENNGKFSNSMCYELVGEVSEEVLQKEEIKTEILEKEPLDKQELNALIKAEIPLRKGEQEEQESADFSESLPFGKKTDNGDFTRHIKNNINYKEYKSITREAKIYFDISSLFVKKQKDLKKIPQKFSKEEMVAYEKFLKYRKERDKRLSATTIDAIIKRLEGLKESGEDIVALIERSIENGWSGVFPTKEKRRIEVKKAKGASKEDALHNLLFETLLKADKSFNIQQFKFKFVEFLDFGCVAITKANNRLRLVKDELQQRALNAL